MKKIAFLKIVMLTCLFFYFPAVMFSQGGQNDQGNQNNQGNKNKNEAAPFDAGLSILIASGAVYALKKANDKRKKSKAPDKSEAIING